MPCRRFLIFEPGYFAAMCATDTMAMTQAPDDSLVMLYAMTPKIIHER
jgi:hypothetical protein